MTSAVSAREWISLVATALLGVLVSGCSQEARYRVLSTLFEEVPRPGEEERSRPVVQTPRHPPSPRPSPSPTVAEAAPPTSEPEQPNGLPRPDILSRLPKDGSGGVDWVRALEEKAIAPRPGLNGEADQFVFTLDVERVPPGLPLFKVTFPHRAHTQWLACVNCHPGIFQMQRGSSPITMTKIYHGEYCGRCHSKVSFAVATGCARCHRMLAGGG